MKNEEYERLYDRIQEITNEITNFCGAILMTKGIADDQQNEEAIRLRDLSDRTSDLTYSAHELEEWYAWEEDEQKGKE